MKIIRRLAKFLQRRLLGEIFDNNLLLILIFVVALGIRFLGVHPGYPLNHADEPTITASVRNITFNLDFKPIGFYYGQLLPVLYALVNILFFLPLNLAWRLTTQLPAYLNEQTGIWRCLENSSSYELITMCIDSNHLIEYLARYESAFLSSLTTILIYFLGRRLFNKEVGLIAAFFAAINYRHVMSSFLALADAPAAFFATLSVLAFVSLIDKSTTGNYLKAAVALSFSLSVKYFIYVVPTFLLSHGLSVFKDSGGKLTQFLKRIINLKLVAFVVLVVAIFLLINPHLIIQSELAKYEFAINNSRYGIRSSLDQILAIKLSEIKLFQIYYIYNFGLGKVLSIVTVFGFLYTFFRHTKSFFLISSSTISFTFFILVLTGTVNVRNYAAILPLFMLYPAILLYDLVKIVAKRRRIFMLTLFALALSFEQTRFSLLAAHSFSKTHNYVKAVDWIDKNIPENAVIYYTYGTHLPSKNFQGTYLPQLETYYLSLSELQLAKADWVGWTSAAPNYVNGQVWFNYNDLVYPALKDEEFLWRYLDNTYASLLTRELGNYRVAEFVKPHPYSLDPAFFVVKVPGFWDVRRDKLVSAFGFDLDAPMEDWTVESFSNDGLLVSNITQESKDLKNGIFEVRANPLASSSACHKGLTKISSPRITLEHGKWYSLEARGKRSYSPVHKNVRNGFLRFDIYSAENKRITTFVSGQLAGIDDWQNLYAAGLIPGDASYAKVSFQLNNCNEEEKYYLDDIKVYSSDRVEDINKSEYPFLEQPLSRSFIWNLPL